MHWSHPSFGPLQPGAAAHERVEPPATTVTSHTEWAGGEASFSCACPQSMRATFPPSRTKMFLSVIRSIRSHWVPAGHWVFTEDHTLDADHHEWIQKKKSFYLGESQCRSPSTCNKKLDQHHWDWMKLGFCWRNWRSQETAIGCGEGFKDLSAQDLTSM